MSRIYKTISPVLLLLGGWVLVAGAMSIRVSRGLDIPVINWLFVILGLAACFLPVRYAEKASGEALRRKLLWLLVAAGVLILAGELVRGFWLAGGA